MSRWEIVKGTFAVSAALAVIAAPFVAYFVWNFPPGVRHWLNCNNGSAGTPTWSPDGKWLVFAAEGKCDTRLVEIHPDGSGFRALTRGFAYWPSWSTRGDEILANTHGGFSVIPAGGGLPRVLIPGASDEGAALSPNGRRIAFTSGTLGSFGGDPYTTKLFVAERRGTGRKLLAGNSCDPGAPSWSPDGRWIVFGCYDGIYLANPGTAGSERILAWPFEDEPPLISWSPDGQSLAFVDYNSSGVFVMDRTGRNARRIISANTNGYTDSVTWSPDGKWLAYSANAGAKTDGIYLIRPNGTDNHRIARF